MNQQELSHALRKEAIKNGHAVQTLASGYSMFPFLRKGTCCIRLPPFARNDLLKSRPYVVYAKVLPESSLEFYTANEINN